MLRVARMLTNVKGRRLIPDHEKVMTADGKFVHTQKVSIFLCFQIEMLGVLYMIFHNKWL